jgi:hypothetical protein
MPIWHLQYGGPVGNMVVQLGNLRAAADPFILADATAAGG